MKIADYAEKFGWGVAQEMFEDSGVSREMPADRIGRYAAAMLPINCSFYGKHWGDLRKETQLDIQKVAHQAAAAQWVELTSEVP